VDLIPGCLKKKEEPSFLDEKVGGYSKKRPTRKKKGKKTRRGKNQIWEGRGKISEGKEGCGGGGLKGRLFATRSSEQEKEERKDWRRVKQKSTERMVHGNALGIRGEKKGGIL